MTDPELLISQLEALIENPDAFSQYQKKLIQLSKKAVVIFDTPLDTLRRFAHSVCSKFMALL